jgi:hypothetical protein
LIEIMPLQRIYHQLTVRLTAQTLSAREGTIIITGLSYLIKKSRSNSFRFKTKSLSKWWSPWQLTCRRSNWMWRNWNFRQNTLNVKKLRTYRTMIRYYWCNKKSLSKSERLEIWRKS